MNTRLILDSSVVAKWFFPENGSEIALALKDKFANNDISIIIPILLYYEINNILRTAIKTLRINAKDAKNVYSAFLDLNFVSYTTELLFERTLETAIKFDISSYDASYVALSEYLRIPFITADNKLLNKVKNNYIIELKNYIV